VSQPYNLREYAEAVFQKGISEMMGFFPSKGGWQ
jgi:hypothetical protein